MYVLYMYKARTHAHTYTRTHTHTHARTHWIFFTFFLNSYININLIFDLRQK